MNGRWAVLLKLMLVLAPPIFVLWVTFQVYVVRGMSTHSEQIAVANAERFTIQSAIALESRVNARIGDEYNRLSDKLDGLNARISSLQSDVSRLRGALDRDRGTSH